MDLTPSDEQRLLRESADRFVAETCDADHRRRMASEPPSQRRDLETVRRSCWLALPFPRPMAGSVVARSTSAS